MRVGLFLIGCWISANGFAAPEAETLPDLPRPPSLGTEEMEPEVTIIKRGEEQIEEYRINGQLYMIKITPVKGPPYYLLDTDGDGSLDATRKELDPKVLVPHWTIFRW